METNVCEVFQVIGHKYDRNQPGEHGQAKSRDHTGQKKVVQKWISKGQILHVAQMTQKQDEGIVKQ